MYTLTYPLTCLGSLVNLYPGVDMTKQKKRGVPVSLRALVQRINRRLKRDWDAQDQQGEMLKATRGDRARQELGDYYILNPYRNFISRTHRDPETLGRELGVLAAFEYVVDGEAP